MKYLSIVFILLGVLGFLHQGLFCNQWWNWADLKHHEPIILAVFVAGVFLLIGQSRR